MGEFDSKIGMQLRASKKGGEALFCLLLNFQPDIAFCCLEVCVCVYVMVYLRWYLCMNSMRISISDGTILQKLLQETYLG